MSTIFEDRNRTYLISDKGRLIYKISLNKFQINNITYQQNIEQLLTELEE